MITNEEKAKELANQLLADDQNQQPLIDVLMQMAKWKDVQFGEKIEELKRNIITARDDKEYYQPKPKVALDWVVRLIDEIFLK